MSRLHREHPDATPDEIAALERAELLRGGMPRITREEANEEVHASIEERRRREQDELGIAVDERDCRDCGTTFTISHDLVERSPGSKWTNLCPSCLQYEI